VSLQQFLIKSEIQLAARQPSADTRHRILFFAHRYGRPFLLGYLANDIGWSLERTEQYVQSLVEQKELRALDSAELVAMCYMSCACVYVVVGDQHAQTAHDM
jgi:hypothetical protein